LWPTQILARPAIRKRLAIGSVGVGILFAAVTLAYGAVYEGTSGSDVVIVERGGSVARLFGGNDTFEGAQGKPSDPGDDWGGVDHVFAGSGDDAISSHTYSDMLHGGDGEDFIQGGAHADGVYGGPGDDTLIGGAGSDLFKPRGGTDECFGQRRDRRLGKCEVVHLVP
jgi:Ca2+-binding RTX toxin-like protein